MIPRSADPGRDKLQLRQWKSNHVQDAVLSKLLLYRTAYLTQPTTNVTLETQDAKQCFVQVNNLDLRSHVGSSQV